jgi:acetate---CoA ligase (ADP-forming)
MDLYTRVEHNLYPGRTRTRPDRFCLAIGCSGAGGVVDYIRNKGVGFSNFASLGNEADISETDMIEYLEQDDQIRL